MTEVPISAGRRWNEVRSRTVLRGDDAANGFPDQSARGAGRVGASLYEGGFPPRETRPRGRDPTQEGPLNIKVAEAFGPCGGELGGEALSGAEPNKEPGLRTAVVESDA